MKLLRRLEFGKPLWRLFIKGLTFMINDDPPAMAPVGRYPAVWG